MSDPTHNGEVAESLIRFVETGTAEMRDPEGDLSGYIIGIDDWRQMRAAIRRLALPPGSGDSHE